MKTVLCSFTSKLTEYLSWVYQERRWTNRELLIAALVLLILLLVVLRRRRKKTVRMIRPEHFAQGSSVIGSNLGSQRQNRHAFRESPKSRSAHVLTRHEKQQKASNAAKRPRKPDERAGRPHWEIVKPRQPVEGFKKNVAEPTGANKQFRREAAEGKSAAERFERKAPDLTAANEQLQPQVAEREQAEEKPDPKVAELTAANEQLRREIAERRQAEERFEQKVAELTAANEQLQREAAERRQAKEGLDQKVAELTAANEELRQEATEYEHAGRRRTDYVYEDEHRVVDGVKQKLCRKCGDWKAQSEFHKNASRKDGLARWCKVCRTRASREYRQRRTAAND